MVSSLIVILGVVQSVALMTQAERKVMGALQRRVGPNKVGYIGLLQPFADGVKLILKESVLPLEASNWLFLMAPFLTFYLALQNWLVVPLDFGVAVSEQIGGGILVIIAINEQGIYGTVFSGWASNSKFSFQGSIRSTAQMISYSVSLSLIILTVIFAVGSVDLMEILTAQRHASQMPAQLPMFLQFIVSAVAETNRSPFDQPEAESELVSGFMTEYASFPFACFFLAEYTNMLTIATIMSILFLGVSLGGGASQILIFIFLWLRASQARQRFDQQLVQGWSHILPFTMGYAIFLPAFLFTFDILS